MTQCKGVKYREASSVRNYLILNTFEWKHVTSYKYPELSSKSNLSHVGKPMGKLHYCTVSDEYMEDSMRIVNLLQDQYFVRNKCIEHMTYHKLLGCIMSNEPNAKMNS